MASSRKQVVNTDVTTLRCSAAGAARRPAAALDEPASVPRTRWSAQHLRSFDAEPGRTQPSLSVHHGDTPRLMTVSDGAPSLSLRFKLVHELIDVQ
jgi:hypothetical protein